MEKTLTGFLILWLSAWNCHALDTSSRQNPFLETENNHFPQVELGTSRFSPFSDETSGFSPLDKGTVNFPPFEKEGVGGIAEILPPDIAFQFSSHLENPTLLVARWQIADDCYLYRDQFQFALKAGGVLGEPQFPLGIVKDDIKFGSVEVYQQMVEVKLPILDTQGLDTLTLETTYQGCAEDRFCYPPITKTAVVDLPNTPSPMQVATTNPSELGENQSQTGWLNTSSTASEHDSPDSVAQDKWGDASELDENVDKFLTVDEAFVFAAEFPESTYLRLQWQIADGYYLYRDQLKFSLTSGGTLGTPQLPSSLLKKDALFGDVQIYQQPLLEIAIPIQADGLKTVTLQVQYQGCAVAGLCYPPTTKIVDLSLGEGGAMSEQDRLANLLANANVWYTLLIFFGLGLLLSLTPCVYPMIPILSGIIVGQGQQMTTYKAFLMSVTYVLAMALTYAVVGVLTGLLGENLQAAFQNPWVLVSFALVFVALAFSMFGFYELQMPSALQTKLTILSHRQQGGTFLGVGIMGILSALIVGPCVAAPLAGALIYIGQTGDALLGGFALFVMSLGMGMPLIVVGVTAGHFLPKAESWMNSIKAIFGVILLAVAIWMLERVIPGPVTMLLWASLLIISAVYMGTLDSLKADASGWRKLWKGLGLIFLVYGVLLMIGAASGHVNPLQPLQNWGVRANLTENASDANQALPFKLIKGVDELERELAAAQAQPVLLDFYADWCISCKEMEHLTFTEAEVQKLLAHFVLLKADVTLDDEQDKALYKRFGIFGPPAVVFFDSNGQEQPAHRIVGYMPADKFRHHLKEVLQP